MNCKWLWTTFLSHNHCKFTLTFTTQFRTVRKRVRKDVLTNFSMTKCVTAFKRRDTALSTLHFHLCVMRDESKKVSFAEL